MIEFGETLAYIRILVTMASISVVSPSSGLAHVSALAYAPVAARQLARSIPMRSRVASICPLHARQPLHHPAVSAGTMHCSGPRAAFHTLRTAVVPPGLPYRTEHAHHLGEARASFAGSRSGLMGRNFPHSLRGTAGVQPYLYTSSYAVSRGLATSAHASPDASATTRTVGLDERDDAHDLQAVRAESAEVVDEEEGEGDESEDAVAAKTKRKQMYIRQKVCGTFS